MKKGQMTQLFSVLLLFVLVVGVVLFVLPMRDTVADLQAERDAASDELQGLQTQYDALAALADEVSSSESTKQALLASVPEGLTQDDLILELSAIADEVDFDLNAMNFSQSVDPQFGDSVTVVANFSGSYDDLIRFLQKIEGADRLLRVTGMNLQLTGTSDIVFNLNIEAYYQ